MLASLHHRRVLLFAALLCCGFAPSHADSAEPRLNSALAAAMGPRDGAAVVVDVASGNVLGAHHLELAARRLAAPGSTVKAFVLLELLRLGRIDPRARLACPRVFPLAGRKLDCSHPAVPPLSAAEALAWSCNYYFAHAAEKLSDSELRQALIAAGLASPVGVKGEALGHVEVPRTLEQRQLLALGEFGIEVTPLELLHAYRRLAMQRGAQNAAAFDIVFEGLDASVDYGMASPARSARLSIAGKTGTSVAPGNTTHGWFVGFAPAKKPEIAFIVYLERGRGREAAAIAAKALANYTPRGVAR